jgi:triacylglycerol esterase/lipase EstA (alpha/beta hydrolase family)
MTVIFGVFAFLLVVLGALLAVSAALLALSVVLSFSIAWFDRINNDPVVAEQRRHALAVKLLLSEFFCLLLTLLLRPLGWLPARIAAGTTRQTPVILLHGLFQNRSCLLLLQWRLRAAGFDRVISVNTPPWRDLESLVDTVAATVEAVRQATGSAKVHLVGHSMGGILARCYLQLRNGAPRVANCVTLGTPHRGSKLAPFAVSRLGRSLRPGSELLARLNAAPLPENVRFTAIYTRHDNIIVPMESARLAGAHNIELSGLGHTTLLFSPQVAKAVVRALKSPRPPHTSSHAELP